MVGVIGVDVDGGTFPVPVPVSILVLSDPILE